MLGVGQVLVGEQLDQVAEIIAALERDPDDFVHEYDARRREQLGEMHRVYAVLEVLLEHYTRFRQQIDRLLRVHILTFDYIYILEIYLIL